LLNIYNIDEFLDSVFDGYASIEIKNVILSIKMALFEDNSKQISGEDNNTRFKNLNDSQHNLITKPVEK